LKHFAALGILPVITGKLNERSITCPTAIQCRVIPGLLEGRNIVFRSATGTGKTFAYLIPVLQRLVQDPETDGAGVSRMPGPAVIICAPTYELCSQIKTEIDFLITPNGTGNDESDNKCVNQPFSSLLLIGSVSLNRQIESLKKTKPVVVVGNPGRLLALLKMGKLKLGGLRFLVLDEADRMTAEDSAEEIQELLHLIAAAARRRSAALTAAACSATISVKTKNTLAALLPAFENAEIIESDEQEILREHIEHWAIFSEDRRKTQALRSFLAAVKPKKALVFAGRADEAGKIAALLQRQHISAAALYGGMDKKARKEAVDGFRSGKFTALVSSDLAARGLDIPAVSHVIALDVSEDGEAYIHRAGRTARAGKRGIMVSIGDEAEMRRLAALEKKLKIVVRPKELYGGRVYAPEDLE
jgi:superfamily II DNA/RNA helicase